MTRLLAWLRYHLTTRHRIASRAQRLHNRSRAGASRYIATHEALARR